MIPGYFDGIVGNLMLVPIYYPGWVMRLYYDLEDGDTITKVRFRRTNNNEYMNIIEFVYCCVWSRKQCSCAKMLYGK